MSFDLNHAAREELVHYINTLHLTIKQQQQQLSWLQRQLFGAKSERLIPQDPRQATLFEVPAEPPAENVSVKEYERTARVNPTDAADDTSKLRFDASVPVEEEVIWPAETKGLKADAYEVISSKVTERLMQIPALYKVKRTIRHTVKLKASQTLHTAPAPASVIERSFADVSLLTGLITDKFLYHTPLHRQHQRMERAGVQVSRSQLTNLVHRSLELLEPIYYAVLSSILTSELIQMDETPVKAGRKIKGQLQTAYFWPVLAEGEVAFIYSNTRGQRVVFDALNGVPDESRCRKLVSDGYSAYEAYAKSRAELIHANCWAHARRKFYEAQATSAEECKRALDIIRELFELEARIKAQELVEEEILAARGEVSLALVEEFFSYLNKLMYEQQIDQTGLLYKAVSYSLKLESGLRQFLYHADIPLSNNAVERAIRPVALGRKNWLFCWSEVGAKYAAIAFTLIESCKLANVDPFQYLADVLVRIDTHPAREVHLLTPKHWRSLFTAKPA